MERRYYVTYQYQLFDSNGDSNGYCLDKTEVASEEEGWALVKKLRRYLSNEVRARLWAEQEELGYDNARLVSVFGLYWEPVGGGKIPWPPHLQDWKEPGWLKALP